MNITISEDDLDALRRILHARDREPLDAVLLAALDRIITAAERGARQAPGGIGDRIEDRAVGERICNVCGDPCARDLARMLWHCRGCLAAFVDDQKPAGQRGHAGSIEARFGSGAPLNREPAVAACAGVATPAIGSSAGDAPTTRSAATLVIAAVLYPLPRGGRVVFSFPDGERSAYLPGRRFDLVRALLVPPPPYVAGDLIPNTDLIERVWEDDAALGGRRELNVLLTRCRQDLAAAGIAAATLFERAHGGGAARLCLAPGARVTVARD